MSFRNWSGRAGENIARIREQSIDVNKVIQLASDYEAAHATPVTIQLSALDWMWLGVAIDLLEENLWILRGDYANVAHEQILNAMGALMPFTYIIKLTLNNETVYLADKEATLLTSNRNEAFHFEQTPLWGEIHNRFAPQSMVILQLD